MIAASCSVGILRRGMRKTSPAVLSTRDGVHDDVVLVPTGRLGERPAAGYEREHVGARRTEEAGRQRLLRVGPASDHPEPGRRSIPHLYGDVVIGREFPEAEEDTPPLCPRRDVSQQECRAGYTETPAEAIPTHLINVGRDLRRPSRHPDRHDRGIHSDRPDPETRGHGSVSGDRLIREKARANLQPEPTGIGLGGSGKLRTPKRLEGADVALRRGAQHPGRHCHQQHDAGATGPPGQPLHRPCARPLRRCRVQTRRVAPAATITVTAQLGTEVQRRDHRPP